MDKVMPSVKGMGLRDAMYLAKQWVWKVEVSGTGKVVYQSLSPVPESTVVQKYF